MQKTLKIAGLQADLKWHDPKGNTSHFDEIIRNLTNDVDLIVLPEMFATGFSMQPEGIADTGASLMWMKEKAVQTNAAIAGSLMTEENGDYFNRFYFVTPQGEVEQYDKRHRFTLAGEHKVYKRGLTPKTVTFKGWKIALQVCYDLRFPVFSRNTQAYDLVLYVANWPKTRVFAWDTLLKARAIENMSYCVGVNRVGTDDNGYDYDGHSGIYDSLGATLAFAEKRETSLIATLT
ncbi:MAG: amidohydrolase, partial [Leeuwenhoekiella sp.]